MSGSSRSFWKGFASGYAPDRNDLPPAPKGLVPVKFQGHSDKLSEIGPPDSLALWMPRAFLKLGGPGEARGPVSRLARLNRRNPGLRQTLKLISQINPTGTKGEKEMRLHAIAALHARISRGHFTSEITYDVTCAIITELDLNDHPDGWASRTIMTLPLGKDDIPDTDCERVEDAEAVGKVIGSDVAKSLRKFVPVTVLFEDTRKRTTPSWKSVSVAFASVTEPGPCQGKMTWRVMTPGKMSKLVWRKSLVDIGREFGVSDKAVRAFCRQNDVSMPSAGFWRMSEEKRQAVQRAIIEQPPSEG